LFDSALDRLANHGTTACRSLAARSAKIASTASAANKYRQPARKQGTRPASASSRSQLCVTRNRRAMRDRVRSSKGVFMRSKFAQRLPQQQE
jgi:hypothetical protein